MRVPSEFCIRKSEPIAGVRKNKPIWAGLIDSIEIVDAFDIEFLLKKTGDKAAGGT